MSFIFLYLLKLSICLAVVFLFYYAVLRKLTFYNWNRYYLLLYTAASFYIPLIDVSALFQQNEWQSSNLFQWVPVINNFRPAQEVAAVSAFSFNAVFMILLLLGMLVMLARVAVQLFSFRKMKQRAQPLYNNGTQLYQVDDNIIPFSFGNSIFINCRLHSETELKEIVRHEFVHVKQKHSVDIIWGELLCVINWFNPFAWLIKKAIRQNLEFIADDKVLENGMCKKEYQYLLLKVTGNNQFSIAAQFNFSSLKKRIAMMNKMKSARMHLIKFLFLLPLVAVLLLAFRNKWQDSTSPVKTEQEVNIAGPVADVSTRQPLAASTGNVMTTSKDTVIDDEDGPPARRSNSKGFYINIIDQDGHCTVVVMDKSYKEVKRLLLTEWNAKEDYYEGMYGQIPVPPVPPVPPVAPMAAIAPDAPVPPVPPMPPHAAIVPDAPVPPIPMHAPVPPVPPVPPKLPANVKSLEINNEKATVRLKNGKEEVYDLNDAKQKKEFQKKYDIDFEKPGPAPAVEL